MAERRRSDVNETWMNVAREISKRSRCVRSAVGCVIVDMEGRVVATGYNGPPADWHPNGITHLPPPMMCDSFCPRALDESEGQGSGSYTNCVSIHAELNALLCSDRSSRIDATMYTSRIPCGDCAKAIANSGIAMVVYGPMPEGKSLEIHQSANAGCDFMERCGILTVPYTYPQ